MDPKKFIWQIFPSFVLVSFVGMIILTISISIYYQGLSDKQTTQNLMDRARILEPELAELIQTGQWVKLSELTARLGPRDEVRVTLFSAKGKFLSDSRGNIHNPEDLSEAPEVQVALRAQTASFERFDNQTQKEMLYVALPVHQGAMVVGVVRLGIPLGAYKKSLSWVNPSVLWSVVTLSLAAALFGVWAVSKAIAPLQEIHQAALSFSKGDLKGRLPGFETLEFDQLATSLNQMAAQLNDRFETITCQKVEQEAIFEGISEGLVVLDQHGLVTNLNPAAIRILGFPEMLNKRLVELIRHPDLDQFVQQALGTDRLVSIQFEPLRTDQILQATGSSLVDSQGRKTGVLLTFYDLTPQIRLENIRKEFVANVSHELKTPITSIKGFVETLLDGAKDDPGTHERFLKIILKQSDRLEMIVEDLLSLARIEQAGFGKQLERTPTDLRLLCRNALQTCQHKADSKEIDVSIEDGRPLWLEVNPTLIEQVILNLIDNAIKYSPPQRRVVVSFKRPPQGVVILVQDQGIGISLEAQSRIFERFYRVDKARSGKDASTGLGLAIVKNIAKLHQGTIEVSSKEDQGSLFSLHLPRYHPF